MNVGWILQNVPVIMWLLQQLLPSTEILMKKFLVLAALAFGALQAHAAPASEESIDRLFTIMKVQSTTDGMYAQLGGYMRKMMEEALDAKAMSPADREKALAFADAYVARTMPLIREEFGWAKMRERYVRIYRESFSQEEVNGLIAFYSSPAGQAFVDKMPLVMQKSMNEMSQMMGTLAPRLAKLAQESAAEFKKTAKK